MLKGSAEAVRSVWRVKLGTLSPFKAESVRTAAQRHEDNNSNRLTWTLEPFATALADRRCVEDTPSASRTTSQVHLQPPSPRPHDFKAHFHPQNKHVPESSRETVDSG